MAWITELTTDSRSSTRQLEELAAISEVLPEETPYALRTPRRRVVRHRCSITGRLVSREYAEAHPDTTQKHTFWVDDK
jgi:hypothetical protein